MLTDLSQKTSEELILLNEEICNNLHIITKKQIAHSKAGRMLELDKKGLDAQMKEIVKETTRRKNLEETNHIITEDIRSIAGFDTLSENELLIISTKMDRTDYRKYGEYPRWLDLRKIVETVIDMKQRYPKWILSNLSRGGQLDTLPPETFYTYEFKDEANMYAKIGGIQIIK